MARTITSMTCRYCGETKESVTLGMCEECEHEHVYCSICKEWHPEDAACRHVFWSREYGDWLGVGISIGDTQRLGVIQQSVNAVLDKTLLAEQLARTIRRRALNIQYFGTVFGWEGLTCYMDAAHGGIEDYGSRFTDDLTEEQEHDMALGVGWLVGLYKGETRRANRLTLQWIHAWTASHNRNARRARSDA